MGEQKAQSSTNHQRKKDVREVRALLRFLRQGPRKVRLVGNVLRGLDIRHARTELAVLNKRPAAPLLKLLNSAVANAKNNFALSEDRLFVKQVRVDEGPSLKRLMPRAHGRATIIKKRSCHVTLILGIREDKRDSDKSKEQTNK